MFNLAYQPTGEEMMSEDNNISLCDTTQETTDTWAASAAIVLLCCESEGPKW